MIKTSHINTGKLHMRMICTSCDNNGIHDMSTFTENVNAFQSEGWLVVKDQGEWKHFCPDHSPDATEEQKTELHEKQAFLKRNGLNPNS